MVYLFKYLYFRRTSVRHRKLYFEDFLSSCEVRAVLTLPFHNTTVIRCGNRHVPREWILRSSYSYSVSISGHN